MPVRKMDDLIVVDPDGCFAAEARALLSVAPRPFARVASSVFVSL